jgi:hypothetical protein
MEEVKKLFSSPVNLVQDRLAEGVVALDRVRLKKELYAWVLAELFQKNLLCLDFHSTINFTTNLFFNPF